MFWNSYWTDKGLSCSGDTAGCCWGREDSISLVNSGVMVSVRSTDLIVGNIRRRNCHHVMLCRVSRSIMKGLWRLSWGLLLVGEGSTSSGVCEC